MAPQPARPILETTTTGPGRGHQERSAPPDPRRQEKAMFAHPIRHRAHPRTTALKARTRLRRIAAALVAVTIGLLASAATIPAAFASDVPQPGSGYQLGRFGLAPATTSHAAAAGMPGWQIILITVSAALVAAGITIVLARARTSHRPAPAPAI
jgi:hypothetical protein